METTPAALGSTVGDTAARAARMNLASDLAAQVDASWRLPPLTSPLLNWHEGDAIAHLLEALAAMVRDEPLAELADELAALLRARLGPMPGHDPERIAAAVLGHLGRRLGHDSPDTIHETR
ncbi:hypothetical protein [Streptosporangium sandarakinum]|uniref:hypothetical protein n=1 Tax=Streptosporangium sandarakinum TaxID=1260955 RepID=UPI0036B7FEF2